VPTRKGKLGRLLLAQLGEESVIVVCSHSRFPGLIQVVLEEEEQNKGEEEAKCITQDPVRWQKPTNYCHKENLK